ncbi:MaoC family dehydratase [Amycolatopsis acidiphila]|uniref:MaoC family dehydratase n=1 Tax=Amycolatopsis acidiphila TaxID=715473 RepID=A0A558AH77_9PSEU|nr:MaoC family dehydratase [Amycolatopsis acidiphila]TVT23625.1 MaoC family dehydratase [Amycolatopsis acidiphila]UIJ58611.1 MaoC family dehydratase [Amycolatopsis acidiphila]GHG76497.1 acyl dehydratase [Amycolatopsis acidiphila]
MTDRYFEDYVPGSTQEFGSVKVTEAEIIEFATKYDPQPFHVDPTAAAQSHFGGLIASGWHTAGLMMRLLTENYLSPVSSLGSPGIDELRWRKPVRPGDELRIRVQVLEARPSKSKPDRGLVRSLIEVRNQDDEVVFSAIALNFVLRG